MTVDDERAGPGLDTEVVHRVLAGEVELFRVLVERYQRKLLCFVHNLVVDACEAEDLAQEAFLIAFVKLPSFDHERGSFSAWLFTIAKNCSLNVIAKKRPLPVSEIDRSSSDVGGDEVDDEVARREALRQLDDALDALPIEQRVPFVLAEILEFSLAEVAEIEGLRLGTVKSRVSRAKAKLREALGEQRRPLDATG